MELKFSRDTLLKSLSHIQGIVEKKNTIPILSNVLIEANTGKISISATDLDIIIVETVKGEIIKEGSTTTTAQVLYDIIRKLPPGSQVVLAQINEGQISLISGKSNFKLKCLPSKDFPQTQDDVETESLGIDSTLFLRLLNKTKFAISNDETRHYLNGIYLHTSEENNQSYLNSVATDGHRLSKSRVLLENKIVFEPVILPKKTLFELVNILQEERANLKILSTKSKIKFLLNNIILISKVIDGRFPEYSKVIPVENIFKLNVNLSFFITAIDRINSLSLDRKGALKILINNGLLKLLVNDPSAGDGIEEINVDYNGPEQQIGFNSRYLIDVGSIIEDKNLLLHLKDPSSPVLINDPSHESSMTDVSNKKFKIRKFSFT